MALRGQAKTDYQREYMRRRRAASRALRTSVLSKAAARELRKRGENPEHLRDDYAILRLDRDALKMHLDAHHETRMEQPDTLTRLERLEEANARLAVRITLLEAERAATMSWDETLQLQE